MHDLGRLAVTFGVKGYYLTNPYDAQKRLVAEIIHHWRVGIGGDHSPHRKLALGGAAVVGTVEEAFDNVASREGEEPFVAATTARATPGALPAQRLLDEAGGKPVLLLFGTGYGMTEDLIQASDACLEPIAGRGDFNHLPVRAAVAIYLDRIFNRAG